MNCASSEVLNESTELVDYKLFSRYSALIEALAPAAAFGRSRRDAISKR